MKTVLLQDSAVVALFIHSVFLFPLLALRNLETLILSLYMPLAHLLFLCFLSFFLLSSFPPSSTSPSIPPALPPPRFLESSLSLALWNFTIMWISMDSFSHTVQVSLFSLEMHVFYLWFLSACLFLLHCKLSPYIYMMFFGCWVI